MMDITTSEELKALLPKVSKFALKKGERSIFDVGGKGYYENPTSDMLAFFGDPNEEHGLGDLVLDSLFSCYIKNGGKGCPQTTELVDKPQRELPTNTNLRLDLVFEGIDWVLIIENKIYHTANNDFEEYRSFVKSKFQKKNYYFMILAPKKVERDGWVGITYTEFICEIEKRFSISYFMSQSFNKWALFFRDFIINLKNIVEGYIMDDQSFKFVMDNYRQFVEVNKLTDAFYKRIAKELQDMVMSTLQIREDKVSLCKSPLNWGEIKAIWAGFRRETENYDYYIYILVKDNGSFAVQYYVHRLNTYNREKLISTLKKDGYEYGEESNGTILCFYPKPEKYGSLENAKNEAKEILNKYKEILEDEKAFFK
ncbi:MAG: hypothetical protein PWQ37_2768 [Candidatus Petromonas sp.]|jgi:hypothetical protein|nr:hypothetical protein [Candidatus Petromonas sp.]